MLVDQGLEILTDDECLRLVKAEQVGRVALSIGALPAIFPVNYRMVGGDIIFRTGEGVKRRAALLGTVVGFEVDRIEPASQHGWSVLVIGMATEINGEVPEDLTVSPWAAGERPHWVRVRPEFISGRRIVATAGLPVAVGLPA
jgi:nitroimidazol reductase NimA-like FMN-containing flavoprotein (pyridoxamine 5'-phosphate oxidase superfamily)